MAQLIDDRRENLAVAALHVFLEERDICLFEKISAKQIRCIFMTLVLIDVEHVQRVVCFQRIRAARRILASELIDQNHHLGGSIRELIEVLIKELTVFLLIPVRVLHVKERYVRNGIAFVLGCLIAEMRCEIGVAFLL